MTTPRHSADTLDLTYWDRIRDDNAATTVVRFKPLPRRDPGQTIRDAETALREEYQRGQVAAAERFLDGNRRAPDRDARAAAILRATPWAPEIERVWGIWAAPVDWYGEPVTCRDCGRGYTCLPEDTYYLAAADKTGGVCFGCALAATRPDIALDEPVLEGKIVAKPRGRRDKTRRIT